ncbi:alpha/beta hydrolase [Lapidilactobacillus wuchangensis]|uniref:alpha/beta hydrolase n=1 Tax=Lapidilactobacillus wuchangensis TaxID=2486001 RepID=UPI0017807AC0|nr:alpha/beta fold hydrolase [Lapidilactobacillus wuchangensis]
MDFDFKRDGLKLHGRYENPAKDCQNLVILMHGFTGNLGYHPTDLLAQLAGRLNEQGLATLRFDFNGHGRSEGDFSQMTVLNEIADAQAALSYAFKTWQPKKVSLLGHSQGGVVASMLAGYYADLIDRLVLMAPAATLKSDAQAGKTRGLIYDPHHIPDQLPIWSGLDLGGFYLRTAQTLPIYEVAQQFTGPVCLIHGRGDVVVNKRASEQYHEVYANSELHLLPDADHGFGGSARQPAVDLATHFLSQNK